MFFCNKNYIINPLFPGLGDFMSSSPSSPRPSSPGPSSPQGRAWGWGYINTACCWGHWGPQEMITDRPYSTRVFIVTSVKCWRLEHFQGSINTAYCSGHLGRSPNRQALPLYLYSVNNQRLEAAKAQGLPNKLVSSPDQIFRACPAALSKNRVWTLSLWKLGQVYIWRSGKLGNCSC